MQVVRFTYNSIEVETSIFVFLYLRMSGIYVSERYFNLEPRVCHKMLRALPDREEQQSQPAYDQYDMDLYLICSEEDFREFQDYGYTEKAIVLVSKGNWCQAYQEGFNKKQTVYYQQDSFKDTLLTELLACMKANRLISQRMHAALTKIAEIYCNNNMMELSFRAKYFYTAEDDQQYEEIAKQYDTIVTELFQALGSMVQGWGNTSYIHLQYAALYIAYEGDLYSIRNQKPFLYTAESIANVCKVLLSQKDIVFMLGDSINLLTAQVYGDLMQNTNNAYEYYLAACKEYSAYAYYKKATYLMETEGNYAKVIKYLTRSLEIYPCYYRAWHILGICYVELEKWEKALQAFENLNIILAPRLQRNVLRPMEIEHLFKAAHQSGDILFLHIQHAPRAIEQYLFAERIWKNIDETEFLGIVYSSSQMQEEIKERMKRELNIDTVYHRLSEIYQRLGDKEKAEYYLNRIYG